LFDEHLRFPQRVEDLAVGQLDARAFFTAVSQCATVPAQYCLLTMADSVELKLLLEGTPRPTRRSGSSATSPML
jgi:hypothetical protein